MTIDCSKLVPGQICVTRNGYEVEYIGKSTTNNVKFPYIFFSVCSGATACTSKGLYYHSDKLSIYDIISVKKPKRVLDCWVNVYTHRVPALHPFRDRCDKLADEDRIACLHIVQEYEEGEGLL